MINAIVAMDQKRGIGKGNDLLFRIPQDFERMRSLTRGHPLVMGRKTFESIGRVLPGRTSVVVTSDKNYKVKLPIPQDSSVVVVNSLDQAIEIAEESEGNDEIFVFGGGQIFAQALPKIEKLYLTLVEGDYGADTFFPEFDESEFKVINKTEELESDGYKFRFEDLERQAA